MMIPDEELIFRSMQRLTEKRRRMMAVVKYDRAFALWQAQQDPLVKALKSLYVELTSPYHDVDQADPKFLNHRRDAEKSAIVNQP